MQYATGEVNASLHAAGKIFYQLFRAILQADPFEHLINSAKSFATPESVELREDCKILSRGEVSIQGNFLRNDAEMLQCLGGTCWGIKQTNFAPIQANSTANRTN
jgi:hypothetical protein